MGVIQAAEDSVDSVNSLIKEHAQVADLTQFKTSQDLRKLVVLLSRSLRGQTPHPQTSMMFHSLMHNLVRRDPLLKAAISKSEFLE